MRPSKFNIIVHNFKSSSQPRKIELKLIIDKVTAPSELPRVSRERLLRTLDHSLECCAATIINGRAGTGKTLLVSDFARRRRQNVAWYKVDAADGDLRIFIKYLVESVRRRQLGLNRQNFAHLINTATSENVSLTADAFVYGLSEHVTDRVLIVIDDLHLIYDVEWVTPFFHRLLPLLPPNVHMLITSRSMPPAPLWRMRSKQTLCVIDEPVLAFSVEEAKKLFESYGLPAARADAATRESRGRAAMLDRIASRLDAARKAA